MSTFLTRSPKWQICWQFALLGALLSTSLLAGCGPSTLSTSSRSESVDAQAGLPTDQAVGETAAAPAMGGANAASDISTSGSEAVAPSAPQLVKQAELKLILNNVDDGIEAATGIAKKLQGDVLGLQDWHPQQGNAPREANLLLRVPQQQLDPALEQLRQLGDIEQQSIAAEDVSDQLVDLTARLRNLRQSEAALLKIMERSGKIPEVLEVSRELSTVRDSIERLDAQQQQLKRQVAYSTINLTLTGAIAPVPPTRPLGETLGASWLSASHSVQTFTVGLLQVSLWLLAYSPYLALIAATAFFGYRLRQPRQQSSQEAAE